MYQDRLHAPDSVIGSRLRQFQVETNHDPDAVARRLIEEGHQIRLDGAGNAVIKKGGEEYSYPLGITELPQLSS